MKAPLFLLGLLGCMAMLAQEPAPMPGTPPLTWQPGYGKSEQIAQSRTRLMDALLADDQEVMQYQFFYLVNGMEDDHYQPLLFHEKVLLACLIGRHDLAMREIARLDSISQLPPKQYSPRVYPQDNRLWGAILDRVHPQLGSVYEGIARSALTDEEKAVLSFTVKKIMETGEVAFLYQTEDRQEELNKECDAFLAAHPHSEYEHFVRSFARQVFKPAWGFGFQIGGGYSAHTGELGQAIRGYGGLSVGLEFTYQRLALEIRTILGGTPDTRDALFFDDGVTWPKGISASALSVSATLGYRVVDAKHWMLAPFVGYANFKAAASAKTIEDYPELEDHGLYDSDALAFGLNLEYKIKPASRMSDAYYYPLRLRAAYYKAFNQPVRGDLVSITLSIGLYAQSTKRVY